MKTIVLFFTLILSLLVCKGQNLVQEGKLWSNTSIGSMPGSSYESYFIKFMGDTTINGLAYKKIMKSKDELNANWSSSGYMREETTTRKVFIYNKSANKDILLYDFSLEAGDSILTGDGHSYAKVTKVTNAAFGNSPDLRKQIYFFEPSGTTRWIEGVGSTWGILEGLNSFYTTGATASLVCYHENDELIYHNAKFANCFPKGSARLIVNAGNDTTYCSGVYATEIPMGVKVNIQNGVAPYTYAWECMIVPFGILKPRTASDILNDTTLMSPTFKSGVGGYADQIILKLHVTDQTGNTGTDSIKVRFSKFAYLTGYLVVELNKGDSTQFKFSSVAGGIEPLTFQWQPRTGLSDPDSLVTWAKPEVSTQYNIIATDSCGCVSEPSLAYEVRVKQTSSEFAPIGAEWHYNYRESFMSSATGYYVLKSGKDTIVDNKLCKVLTHTLVSSKDVASGKGRSIVYHDINENKVYRYLYGSFHLLYDFTKQAGDTLIIKEPLSETTYDSIKLVVDSVGIVKFANNIQRKSLFVHPVGTQKYNFSGKIIEGIGNVNFFFFPVNSIGCDSGCPSPLRCYKDQNISEQFTYQTCDFVYTNIDNIKTIDVSVYPNPVSNDLFIEGNFNEKEYILELYSIQGNLIKTECMEGGINLYSMDTGTLKSGSYILRVISQKGKLAERMIIKK